MITSALTSKIQKATRPAVTGSTVKLMDNPLPVKGTGEGGAPTTVDVAQALSQYTKSKLVPLELGEAKPEQMVKRGASIAEHDAQMQSIRPELEDPTKMSLFQVV